MVRRRLAEFHLDLGLAAEEAEDEKILVRVTVLRISKSIFPRVANNQSELAECLSRSPNSNCQEEYGASHILF